MVRKIHKFLIGGPKYIENSKEHTHLKMLGSTDKEERNRADANTNSSQLRPEVNTGGTRQTEAGKERS